MVAIIGVTIRELASCVSSRLTVFSWMEWEVEEWSHCVVTSVDTNISTMDALSLLSNARFVTLPVSFMIRLVGLFRMSCMHNPSPLLF